MKPRSLSIGPALVVLLLLFGCVTPRAEAENLPHAEDFLAKAKEVLPVEERYDYHRSLREGSIHHPVRDPAARATPDEMTIPDQGWTVAIAAEAGTLLDYAARDLKEYLDRSMGISVDLSRRETLDDWQTETGVIVVGTKAQLPDLGKGLSGSKDYEILVRPERIVVCGYDELGAMHGVFNLEARMSLREGPYLPRDLSTVRQSRYRTRAVLSWLGWMQWPDPLLAHIAHDGYDAIYASVYANPNGVPGPPHYDLIRKQNADELHDVIRRANRHGLKVYAPILYNNTGKPENKAQLREHVRDIVTKFPDIHGYILLTEGFYFEKFFGAGGHGDQDLREWARAWTEAVGIVVQECHKINRAIEVLPWEYNIDFRPTRVELKRFVTSIMPRETIPLLTWENGTSFELDGLHGYLRDYSISQVGPAEVAAAQIAEAKRRGMTVYCKVDCFATWQFGTTPYLPCPQQWQRRYDALAQHGVDGTLETWSNGYKPNFIAELRAWSCWTDPIEFDVLLESLARREFGAESAGQVVKAWEHFSRAMQYVPDTGPSMGTNSAVAQPLFFDEPEPRMMTLENSWWDEDQKMHWRHRVIPYWPFAHRIMVFQPDFTNRRNAAEQYARARSGIGTIESPEVLAETPVLPIFNKYVQRAAEEFEAGLRLYRKAALTASPEKRAGAMKHVLVVEQMRRMLCSLHAVLEFEDLRFRLMKTESSTEARTMLDRMAAILREEIRRTEMSRETARLDSRLGYECEMDYVYTPRILDEKLRVLKRTLEEELPAFREGL